MRGKFVYANGCNISVARKFFKYIFAEFFIMVRKNEKELRFEILLKSFVKNGNEIIKIEDWIDLEDFDNYWNERKNNPSQGEGVFKILIMEEKLN